MRAQLETILRELLHDTNNMITAADANITMFESIYLGTPNQSGIFMLYTSHAKKELTTTARGVADLQRKIHTEQGLAAAGQYSQMQPLAEYSPPIACVRTNAITVKEFLRSAVSMHALNDNILYEEAKEHLDGALMASTQMVTLLTHARRTVLNKETPYIPTRTLIADPINEAVTIYAGCLKNERIGLETVTEMYEGRPREFHFMGDSVRLTQVMINLLSNMKYELRKVKHPEVNIHLAESPDQQGYARISIINNGPRISDTEGIFEPGRSGRNSSGLGLPICRHIVRERFGGRIYAKNSPRGPAFYIELPMIE